MRRLRRLAIGGGGAVPLLPFSDNFTRSDGDLGNGWIYTAGKWTVSGNKAVGTPGLGSNINPDPIFNNNAVWTKNAGCTVADGVGHIANVPNAYGFSVISPTVANTWYKLMHQVLSYSAGGVVSVLGSEYGTVHQADGSYINTHIALSANLQLKVVASGTATTADVDNAYLYPITLADMFALRDVESSSVDISVALTITPSIPVGIAMCANADTAPTSFLLVIYDGVTAKMYQCIEGTYTLLTSGAATYSAGASLRAYKNGTLARMFYNGSQVGIDQTVNAAITDNTVHGLFTSDATNGIDSISIAQAASFATYWTKVRDLDAANLVAYWRLNDTSGTQCTDYSGSNRHALYGNEPALANAAGPDGELVPFFDGTDQYVDIDNPAGTLVTAGLLGTIGSAMIWGKVTGVGDWTDDTNRILLNIAQDSNNEFHIKKNKTTISGEIDWVISPNTVQHVRSKVGMTTTGWFFAGQTWDESTTTLQAYLYTAELGFVILSPLSYAGHAWAGTTWVQSFISSFLIAGQSTWLGWIAHCALWKSKLTTAQMYSLSTIYEPIGG